MVSEILTIDRRENFLKPVDTSLEGEGGGWVFVDSPHIILFKKRKIVKDV